MGRTGLRFLKTVIVKTVLAGLCITSSAHAQTVQLANARPDLLPESAHTSVDVTYHFYGGGFEIARLETRVNLNTHHYEINAHMATLGVAERLFPGTLKSRVQGLLSGTGPELTSYAQHYNGHFGERSVTIERRPDDTYTVIARPEDGVHKTGGPRNTDIQSAVDPLTASLFTALSKSKKPCDQSIRLFDGRRVFNLVLDYVATEQLVANSLNAYAGKAFRCKVRYKAIAGFSRQWKIAEAKDPVPPLTVWLAEFTPPEKTGSGRNDTVEKIQIPVKLMLENRIINAVAHLTRATVNGTEMVAPDSRMREENNP